MSGYLIENFDRGFMLSAQYMCDEAAPVPQDELSLCAL